MLGKVVPLNPQLGMAPLPDTRMPDFSHVLNTISFYAPTEARNIQWQTQ
jgi:hypothetical protein